MAPKAPVPRPTAEDTPVATDYASLISSIRTCTVSNRVVIDLHPGYRKVERVNVECSGGSKLLTLVGQEDTLRVFVTAKGEADEWESPAGSGNILKVLGEQPTKKRKRKDLEAHCHQREPAETAVAAVLGDDIFISKIICLLGLHRDESRGVWTKKPWEHWAKRGCGQSCGCCRAHNIEDWRFGGCGACVEMWKLTTVNRQWMNLTKEFDGITETRSRRCKKRERENEGQGGQQA